MKLPVIITPEFSIQNGCEVCRTELSSLSNMQIIEFQIRSTCESIPVKLQLKSVKRYIKQVIYNQFLKHCTGLSETHHVHEPCYILTDRQTFQNYQNCIYLNSGGHQNNYFVKTRERYLELSEIKLITIFLSL